MKKLLIIIFLISIIPNYTFAAWACLIQDKSAKVLLEYVKNNRKVVKNITKNVVKEKNVVNNSTNDSWFFESAINTVWDNLSKAQNESISIFNELFNYPWFYSYFNYFAVHPISNEVPFQVKRDYKILDNENKWLIEYVKKLDTRWWTDTIVKDACSWVDKNCNLDNKSSKEIIWELIKNNDKILDLFRLTVMWESKDFEWDLILVDNNFNLEIEKNYWPDSISECNSIEWWFFETISTAIDNIKLLSQQWEDWIQMWRDAWDLMLWTEPDHEALQEREVLRSYLSNEWISLQNQEIMDDNLSKYNQWWLSVNNNFISNTISSTFTKIDDQMGYWKDAIVWDFFTQNNTTGKDIVLNNIQQATDNSKINIDLKERIAKLYNDELPFAAVWDINTENIRAKIIETHMSLDDSILILEKTIKVSQKVCTSQDTKRWKCN